MRAYAIEALPNGIGDVIHSEYDSTYTTDRMTVSPAATDETRELVIGAVLGAVERGAATVTPAHAAGNTADGSLGTWTADAGAQVGVYNLVVIEPASNAGKFEVTRPDGVVDGIGTIGVAYNGMINGTWADGTDAVAGDRVTVTVAYADAGGKVLDWDPDGTDGSQTIVGICLENLITDDTLVTQCNVLARGPVVVRKENLVFATGTTSDEKLAAYAQLTALGIQVRTSG